MGMMRLSYALAGRLQRGDPGERCAVVLNIRPRHFSHDDRSAQPVMIGQPVQRDAQHQPP